MSSPSDVMCYKCYEYPGTEQCCVTGFAICQKCLESSVQDKNSN